MKLKLPQQLLLALLATFSMIPSYAADVSLSQIDASAGKTYESGTEKTLGGAALGQTNFILGESVTFENASYTYAAAKLTVGGVVSDSAPCYGNIFKYNRTDSTLNFNAATFDTLKGTNDKAYSLSFNNNTSSYNTAISVDSVAHLKGTSYGGAAYFESMIFSNLDKLSFSGNKMLNAMGGAGGTSAGTAKGGALYGETLLFTSMNELSFTDNTLESNYWAMGGALYSRLNGVPAQTDKGFISFVSKVIFDANQALASSSRTFYLAGGALASHAGNSAHRFTDIGEMTFSNNRLGYTEGVTEEGIPITSRFEGGAVFLTNFMMDRANKLVFEKNSIDSSTEDFTVKAQGGGIHAANTQLLNVLAADTDTGGYSILFEGNKAIVNHTGANASQALGGAIYSRRLLITGSGHILFKNNYSSTLGGAVYLAKDYTTVLASWIQATGGDVTFVGNTHRLADSNERNSGIANSFYLEGGFDHTPDEADKQMELMLMAASGRTIYLYDAIDSAELNAANLAIHFGGGGLNGAVVFSGEKVEETLADSEGSPDYAARVEASKQSAINAQMALWEGSLVLKSGVTLGKLKDDVGTGTGSMFYHQGTGMIDISNSTLVAEEFDATYSSDEDGKITGGGEFASWKIGAGAKLVANTINFSDGMSFDLSHYMTNNSFNDHGGMQVTATSTSFGGKMMISDHADYYTDNIWAQKGVFTLLDTTNAGATGDFTDISSKLTGSNLVEDPYQYKGEWTYEWVGGTQLVAIWTPLGWIEDVQPELEGNIVSNSMWSSASNAKSLSSAALGNVNILRLKSELQNNFWLKGIGDFAYDDSSAELDGYSYQGGGYAAGADFKIAKQSILGVAFGQLIGHNKSELYNAKIKQDSMMGSIYGAHLQTLNKSNSLLWTLAGTYGDTENSMNTHYSDGQNSSGTWNNNTYFLEAQLEWRIAPEGKNWTYKPFIGVEYTDVTMESFTETGDKVRHFGEGSYKRLSLPIGMGIEHQSRFGHKTWLNTLSLAYVPDVYREAPNTQATRLSNGFSWNDQGSKANIHTLRATINSTLQFNAAWTAYAGYTFEARGGASYHNVNTGVSYSF